jgi:SAM-dependent methyltransferase
MRANLNQARMLAQQQLRDQRYLMNGISYGPFTEAQLRFVVEHHPRLLEIGCGSGYAISILRERGVDAIGIDPGSYRNLNLEDGSSADILHSYEWSAQLLEAGALLQGSVELIAEHSEDRTLLISWAEPGSRWPTDAVEAFRAAGGKRLLLKLGGFVGVHFSPDPGYRAPENPGLNIVAFFEEIAKWWQQSRKSPEWIPELFENNLLSFELRDSPQLLAWEEGATRAADAEPAVESRPKERSKRKRDPKREKKKRKAAKEQRKRQRRK